MARVTWRAPEALVLRLRQAAQQRGISMNAFLTQLARAATDPTVASTEAGRLRERLHQAGLAVPNAHGHVPPDAVTLARARRAAERGTSLSDLVAQGRK